jgi:hypothetical protein
MLIIERLAVTAGVTLALIGFAYLLRASLRRRVIARSRTAGHAVPDATGVPTLHYFWSASCSACKVQEMQIAEAMTTLGAHGRSIAIARHNAVTETELVRRLQVVTVPTTVLTGSDGQVVAWNPGLTVAGTIIEQIRAHAGRRAFPNTDIRKTFRRHSGGGSHVPSLNQGTGS